MLLPLMDKYGPTINWALTGSLPSGMTFSRTQASPKSTTALGPDGNLRYFDADQPRFEFNPVTLQPVGLLMEESRTNINIRPVHTASLPWTSYNSGLTSEYGSAPDGTVTSAKTTITTNSAQHFLYAADVLSPFTAGLAYTVSGFLKAGSTNLVQVTFTSSAFGVAQFANFKLSGGGTVTLSSGGSATIKYVGNSWYYVTFTATCSASITGPSGVLIFINSETSPRLPTFVGVTESFEFWGFQCESGSFATSYIPTSGNTVTKALERLYTTTLPWFNAVEGTMLFQGSVLSAVNTNPQYLFIFSNSGTTNTITAFVQTSGQLIFQITSGGVGTSNIGGVVTPNTRFKAALSYKNGVCRAYFNGARVSGEMDTSALPSGINRLDIGNRYDGLRPINGHLEVTKYYNRALSEAELQRITT